MDRAERRARRREILWLLLTAHVVGVVAGLAALAFDHLIPIAQNLCFELQLSVAKHRSIPPPASALEYVTYALAPALGGLGVGLLHRWLGGYVRGHGVSEVVESVAIGGGVVRARTGLARMVSATLTIGTGGSAGKEGPTIQIGAAAGSKIAELLHLHPRRRKVLVACGASAGIAAVFNAPLAGVLFAIEILLGEIFLAAFAPMIIAASVATVIRRQLIGAEPLFAIPGRALEWLIDPAFSHVVGFALVGLCTGVAAVSYVRAVYAVETLADRLRLGIVLRPAVGGLCVGLLGVALPRILGEGEGAVEEALTAGAPALLLLGLALAKILATALTLGSGGSGGAFAPALAIGATLGAAVAGPLRLLPPFADLDAGAFAVVGMAGVVAGALHAPLTAVAFVLALTQEYRIVLPVLVATVASLAVSSLMQRDSLYTWGLRRRGIDVRAGREETVLRLLRVADSMRPLVTVRDGAPFHEVARLVLRSDAPLLAVVDVHGDCLGVLTVGDIREFLRDPSVDSLLIARELAEPPSFTVRPGDDLFEASRAMTAAEAEGVLVVDPSAPSRPLGLLARRDVIDAYQKVLRRRAAEHDVHSDSGGFEGG